VKAVGKSRKAVWKLYHRRNPDDSKMKCEACFLEEGPACLALCLLALGSPPHTWKLRRQLVEVSIEPTD